MKNKIKQITGFFRVKSEDLELPKLPLGNSNTSSGGEFYGSFTFENDKLKVKVDSAKWLSYYKVEAIKKKVTQEFEDYKNSKIFYHVVEVTGDLVSELRDATQDLKNEFFIKTEQSAERQFDFATKNIKKFAAEVDELHKLIRAEKRLSPEYYKLRKQETDAMNRYDRLNDILKLGYDAFLKKELEYAAEHYEDSLTKLAKRLVAKGVTGNFTIKSGRVGVNFEVVITHEKGETRAWTIVAEGPIQRAHYRYLVK